MSVGMRLVWQSLAAGCLITVSLVALVIAPITGDLVRASALWMLSPGILAGFGLGSGHVHDVSFWLLTAIINGVFYTGLVYVCCRLFKFFSLKVAGH
jgi:hypothetical protein